LVGCIDEMPTNHASYKHLRFQIPSMQLSSSVLTEKNRFGINPSLLNLPERVLQFGTGVLLRGLPDFFIDKANKQNVFNGRVVVVKTTDSDSSAFDRQDGLFTQCVRGLENGIAVEENIINASISRVLTAQTQWSEILQAAMQPELKIVISNTTEVGIQLVATDKVTDAPPSSFPGKLLSVMYKRFNHFKGSADSGLIIIPTELVSDNGDLLRSILLDLARLNDLDEGFIEWITKANTFCNSLVDRIVPGRPAKEELAQLEQVLGYSDELLIKSEVFRLWAIAGGEELRSALAFADVDDGVVIAPDITRFKELKLRLLNGTHSYNCGLAYHAGFNITRDACTDPAFEKYARRLMQIEIAPSIPFKMPDEEKAAFADRVYERFCNPFIDHEWLSISAQYTSKMRMRNVPLLQEFYRHNGAAPTLMCLGFAGYLRFLHVEQQEDGKYFGSRDGLRYEIRDDATSFFFDAWKTGDVPTAVRAILSNKDVWGVDLSALPGFEKLVLNYLRRFEEIGVMNVITEVANQITQP
jgi:tagaturonate reductase